MTASALTMAFGALTVLGCTSDAAPERATVTPAGAYIAIVQWEVGQAAPVVDDDGNIEPPVIYLASVLGGTIDAGVQAEVVATIDESAVIRFADDPRDALDDDLEGEPVKDDGVMIVLDEFEPDEPVVDARISRYASDTDEGLWLLEVIATDDGAEVTTAVPIDPIAS
jgi:hypothetical protein